MATHADAFNEYMMSAIASPSIAPGSNSNNIIDPDTGEVVSQTQQTLSNQNSTAGTETNIYRDFDLSFKPDPNTGDVDILNDTPCIRQAINNIICLNKLDIPFNVRDYSSLKRLLFEQDSHAVYASISTNLEYLITTLEPRVKVNDITIEFNELDSSFTVDIKYTITRTNTDDILTKVIERVR